MRYPRITGSRKISTDYDRINEMIDFVEQDVDELFTEVGKSNNEILAHESSSQAHKAEDITYTGDVTGATTTKQAIDNVQTQLNVAVISGDSSPAAAQAAVDADGHDYGNLKLRLDTEQVSVAAQLAETEQQIDHLEETKAPQSALDATNEILTTKASQAALNEASDQLALKATYAYVDNIISVLGDMSPKGAFPTLIVLQTAYPTGAEGIYLVTDTNHWYYWNSTAWTDGGEYQAMPWADFLTTQDEAWEV